MSMPTLARAETMEAGLNYVQSLQALDGSWTEWALPPGSSSAWTTAYVGYQLRSLALPRMAQAARWLSDHRFADGGWGYNSLVGSDADSTANAILFLASAGFPVPAAAYGFLAKHQRADGGFATYLPAGEPHAWNVSHPDVTPVALLALLTHPAPDAGAIQRGIEYVLRQQTAQGLWNSFWWASSLYGTCVSLSVLRAEGVQLPVADALMQIVPTNAFETALLILSLRLVGCAETQTIIHDLADRLINEQRPDGSWDSAPILRVTRRDCYAPWATDDAGQLYAEPSRLFTTSTVLAALAQTY